MCNYLVRIFTVPLLIFHEGDVGFTRFLLEHVAKLNAYNICKFHAERAIIDVQRAILLKIPEFPARHSKSTLICYGGPELAGHLIM